MELTRKQTEALDYLEDGKTIEVLFGGGAGGGKSVLGCYWLLKCALKYPGSRYLMARRAATTLRQTTLNTLRQVARLQGLPASWLRVNDQRGEVAVGTDDRLSGWVPREQLAFGDDMDRVKSTFSQKILRKECRGRPMYASPDMQSTCPLEEGAWLVGTAGDGLYILLTRMGETFFAPQTWFEEGCG